FRKLNVKATLIQDEAVKFQHLEYWFNNFRDAKNIFGYDQTKHQDIIGTEEFKNLAKMIEFIQLEIV
ncbi:MAG: hypothetical protein KAJ72_02370, partial [Candidatus Heimdallarchaeota archaeon]|nr:hypothetical protein [Candidatus Heimdallarchaeota archaeon]